MANDTALVQYKFDRAIQGGVGREVVLNRWYDVHGEITLPACVRGLRVRGKGPWGSGLRFHGGQQGVKYLTFMNYHSSVFENFGVEVYGGSDQGPLHDPLGRIESVFSFKNTAGMHPVSSRPHFEHVRMELRNRCRFGVMFDVHNDVNNEWGGFFGVEIDNYSFAAIGIDGTQSKEHQIYAPAFNGNGFGRVGIFCMTGSFHVYGGRVGGNTECDFYVHYPNEDPISITGYNSEGSARMLYTKRGDIGQPITIRGARWASNKMRTDDPRVVIMGGQGPFTLEGSMIGQGNDHGDIRPVIDLASSPKIIARIQSNRFGCFGSWREQPVRWNPDAPHHITIDGNMYAADDSSFCLVPEFDRRLIRA